ncbi:MAG: permease [Acidobacteria bacterium]|nr:permease [Acidobacteriota bacterium]
MLKQLAVPLVFVLGLIAYKSQSSVLVLQSVWTSGALAGRPQVVAFGGISGVTVLERSINYSMVIWPAMVFGILIGAAVRAFVKPDVILRMFAGNSVKAQLVAGVSGAPLMLCSCCVAPVFTAVYERSQRLAPSLAVLTASPSLNPAALALTFMLFDVSIAAARLTMAIIAVALIGPVIERVFPHTAVSPVSDLAEKTAELEGSSLTLFVNSIGWIALRTAPVFIIGVLSSMLLVQFLPTDLFATSGARFLALVVVSAIAVPLAMPTFLEIPLALSLLAAGLPAGAAAAFLFVGPAVNLPSLLAVSRSAGWKIAAAVSVMIWMIAVMIGSLL